MAIAARMVPVASVADVFEAKLLAARLGAEGIVWELRGNVDGVYPLGPFELLVEEDAVADVRAMLAAASVATIEPVDDGQPVERRRRGWFFTVVVVTAAIAFLVLRTLILWS